MVACSAAADVFTSPKRGAVGEERLKQGAVAGTYWGPDAAEGTGEVLLHFDTGSRQITASARVGENILRAAERAGAMVPDLDFCFEGTCCHCEMEVAGGAPEVGYRADPSTGDLVRSCICPVPAGRRELRVRILSEEDAWGDGVL